ncbi:MAG: insulinase family protein [Chitinophagaceae bacterium]|nr:insulinase family protein [Chitinophagaceae bacterium]
MEHILPLVQEILVDAILPEEELLIYKQNMKQRLAVNLKKCDFIAGRKIDALLFGDHHPYGVYSEMNDYDALQQHALADYYNVFYKNGHCTIFSAGILPSNYQQLLNKYFGSLPFNKTATKEISHAILPSSQKKWNILNDAEGVQGAIRIARACPLPTDPVFPKLQVLNVLFGGFFGSRLMTNIREDKGYTYGIYSYLMNHIHASAILISTEAGRDVCEATVKEVYHEMEQLRMHEVGKEELLLVKNYLIGTLLGDLDGPFHIIGRWKNLILHGMNESHFNYYVDVIKSIESKELKQLAEEYLHPADFYELVVV